MARRTQVKIRGVYGKPIAKAAGSKIALTPEQMEKVGKIILKAIKKEIRRDMALSVGIQGSAARNIAVPLPQSKRFVESFKVRVKGESTIEISSNWPTAEAHINKLDAGSVDNMRPDRSAPIQMTWLRRPEVPYAKIVQQDGQIVIRTTPDPSRGQKFWVHPGFRKYTFLQRGLRKGREEAARILAAELVAAALQEYDLFGGP